MYVCMYVCMYACTYARIHVCMYVCMYLSQNETNCQKQFRLFSGQSSAVDKEHLSNIIMVMRNFSINTIRRMHEH